MPRALPAAAGMPAVAAVLERMRLGEYAAGVEEAGYDDLPFLLEMDDDGLAEVAATVGMKPGHAQKLQRWLQAKAVSQQ